MLYTHSPKQKKDAHTIYHYLRNEIYYFFLFWGCDTCIYIYIYTYYIIYKYSRNTNNML